MDEWRKRLGRRNEAGSFIRDTEKDERINTLNERRTELYGKASTKQIGFRPQMLGV
jgi:hypothetical protein